MTRVEPASQSPSQRGKEREIEVMEMMIRVMMV